MAKLPRLIAAASALLVSLACQGGTALPSAQIRGGDFLIVGSSSGDTSKLTVGTAIKIAAMDIGQQGGVYVAAITEGSLIFQNADGSWSLWRSGSPAAWLQGGLPSQVTIPIISGMDISMLKDLKLIVGYGADVAEMAANNRYMRFSPVDASLTFEGYVTAVDQQCTTQTAPPTFSNPAPLSGAVVSSSLGTQTATSEADGHFFLSLAGLATSQTPFTLSLTTSGQSKTMTGLSGQHFYGNALVPRPGTATTCPTKPPSSGVYCTTNAAGAPILENPPGCIVMGGTVCAPGVAPGTNGCVEKPPLCAVDASGTPQIGNPTGCVVAMLRPAL